MARQAEGEDERALRRRPVQKRSRDRVKKFLDATLKMLEDSEPLSTTAIAARAGSPVGTLYQYFPNLEAILADLAKRLAAETWTADWIEDLQRSQGKQSDWRSVFDNFVDRVALQMGSGTAYAQLFHALRFSNEVGAVLGEIRKSNEDLIDRWLQNHGLPEEDARLVSQILFEVSLSTMLCYIRAPDPAYRARIVGETKHLLKTYLESCFRRFPR